MRQDASIPGPRMPVLLQTAHWMLRPYAFLEDCARRYGDPFRIDVAGWGRLVLVSAPDEVRKIFGGDVEALRAGESNDIIRPLLGSAGLFLLDGERHRHRRKAISPWFRGDPLAAQTDEVRRIAREVIARLPRGRRFPMIRPMQRIALESMLEHLFSCQDAEVADRYQRTLSPVLGLLGSAVAYFRFLQQDRGPLSPGRWAQRQLRRVDDLLYGEIARRRAQSAPAGDVLSALVALRDLEGEPIGDEEVRDHLITLIVAGHDTAATALAWVFHWILRDAELQRRLCAELEEAGPDSPTDVLLKLPLLEAVCLESLRLCPVIEIVSRVNRDPLEIGGVTVEPGCLVSPCIFLTHRRSDLYDEPTCFRPERFLGKVPAPSEFYPFGGGARRCVGSALALNEMKVVVATALSTAHFRLASPGRSGSVRRNVTIAPAGGLPVVMT